MAPPPPPKPPAVPVPLFPPKSKISLKVDGTLNDAVEKAVQDVVASRTGHPDAVFSITIVDLATFGMGGHRADREHYVGSLIKIGVLYAAFAFVEMVKSFSSLRPSSRADLLTALHADQDDKIAKSSNLIFGAGLPKERLPTYEHVCRITDLGSKKAQVMMNSDFKENLRRMLVHSDNDSAAQCIHALGLSYINGALEDGKYFDPAAKQGVWSGGDLVKRWTPVRIPCDNDDPTAQGSTSASMAALLTDILMGDMFPKDVHELMNKWLMDAAHGTDASWLTRPSISNRLGSQITHAKIGFGGKGKSGDGTLLDSEGGIVKGLIAGNKSYLYVFQNIDFVPYTEVDIINVMKRAISVFEGAAPAAAAPAPAAPATTPRAPASVP